MLITPRCAWAITEKLTISKYALCIELTDNRSHSSRYEHNASVGVGGADIGCSVRRYVYSL